MLDGISLGLIQQIGPWGIVTLIAIAIVTGRLVPRVTVQRERELLEKRVEDWKAAYELTERARSVQSDQLNEILDIVRTTSRALRDTRDTRDGRDASARAPRVDVSNRPRRREPTA